MKKHDQIVAGYVPIIDASYMTILERHNDLGHEVGIFDNEIVKEFAPYTRKELRAIQPEKVTHILRSIGIRAATIGLSAIQQMLAIPEAEVTLFHDDISNNLLKATSPINAKVQLEVPFLRWNRANTVKNQEINPNRIVNSEELDILFKDLYEHAALSSDWWRHVAAAIIAPDGSRVTSVQHNRAMPSEQTVNIQSDPRILARQGSDIDLSLFLHAEAGCIAEAAKDGTSVEGASMYVTTFPCPNCAKMIAASGINRLYFTEGYAMLDGQQVLDAYGIEIIQVQTSSSQINAPERMVDYPEK